MTAALVTLVLACLGAEAASPGRPGRTVALGPYRVVLSPGGQIVSLRVGQVEFLQALPGRPAATGLQSAGVWLAPTMRLRADREHEVSFESAHVRIQYRFRAECVDLMIRHELGRAVTWHVRPGDQVVRSVGPRPGSDVDPRTVRQQRQSRSRWLSRAGPALVMPDGRWTRLDGTSQPVPTYGIWVPPGTEVRLRLSPVTELAGRDALAVDVATDAPDFLLRAGRPAGFRCHVENLSARPLSLLAGWSIADVVRATDVQQTGTTQTKVAIPARATRTLAFTLPELTPGVYRAYLDLIDEKGHARTTDWVFGYATQKWAPPLTRQGDFETFWADCLAELRRLPTDVRVVPVHDPRYRGARLFKVSLSTLGGRRCSGWFSVPAGPIPFPALLILPSGGVRALPPPVPNDRAVILCLAVHGYDVDLSDAPLQAPWPGWRYHTVGLARRDTTFLRSVYASCVRAMDFLVSRAEVDPTRIAVTGTGQGGALALVTAALHPRVGLCAPCHSDLCRLDWTIYHTGGGPFTKADKPPGQTDDQFRRTLSYVDAANFTPMIRCPVVALVGLANRATPPAGQLAALASVKTTKRIIVVPSDSHEHHVRARQQQRDAVAQFLRSGGPATRRTR